MVKKQIQMKYIVTFFFCLLLLTECFARPITLQDIPEEQLQLLSSDGMLVKRPILVMDDGNVFIGFQEKAWAEHLHSDI